MTRFIHTWCTPTGLLAIFMFLLPWQTRYIFGWSYLSGDPTQFGTLSLYATQVLLMVGLLVIYSWRGLPKFKRTDKRLFIVGGLFLLANIVSTLLADSSIPAIAGLLELTVAGIFFLALLDERVDLGRVMFALALGLCLPVLLGVVQVFSGGNEASLILGLASRDAQRPGDSVVVLADGVRALRAYGPFPHPNIFGGYLAVGLLSLLGLRSFQETRKSSLIFGVTASILAVGLVLTASRSAIFGLVLGLTITMIALHSKTKKIIAPMVATAIFVALALTYLAPSMVTSLRGGGVLENRSVSERVQQYHDWPSTMHGVDWLIGNGPRNYVFALADEHPQQSVWDYQPIHNVPLLILSEIGIFGFLLMLIFIGFLLRHATAPEASGIVSAVFAIMFFDHYLWSSWAGMSLVAYVLVVCMRNKIDT
jgi:hypothetical protein